DSHRNSSRPKQLSANRIITSMFPSVGARFCISQRAPRVLAVSAAFADAAALAGVPGVDGLADVDCRPKPCCESPDSTPAAGPLVGAGMRAEVPIGLPMRPWLWHSALLGGLRRLTMRLTVGLTSATPFSRGATSQLK